MNLDFDEEEFTYTGNAHQFF